MQQVEFFIVYDTDGNVVGDMDQETARDRYNDEWGNDEFTVRKIVISIPAAKPLEVTLPEQQVTVAA